MSTKSSFVSRIDQQTQAYLGVFLYFMTVIGGVTVFYTLTTALLTTLGVDAAPLPLFG